MSKINIMIDQSLEFRNLVSLMIQEVVISKEKISFQEKISAERLKVISKNSPNPRCIFSLFNLLK